MSQTMTHDSEIQHYQMLLSALSDGELEAKELSDLLNTLRTNPDMCNELLGFWNRLSFSKQVLKGEALVFVSSEFKALDALLKSETLSGEDNVTEVDFSNKSVPHSGPTILQNFAVAASVCFVMVFSWMLSQSEVRDGIQMALLGEPDVQAVQVAELPRVNHNQHKVQVSLGPQVSAQRNSTQFSHTRIENYMRLHAENASLNSNQGILPFARMNRVSQEF